MSPEGPTRWLDRVVRGCVSLLLAAIALYCAVKLIEAILPALIVIVGILAIIGLIIGAIVVYRTSRNGW